MGEHERESAEGVYQLGTSTEKQSWTGDSGVLWTSGDVRMASKHLQQHCPRVIALHNRISAAV